MHCAHGKLDPRVSDLVKRVTVEGFEALAEQRRELHGADDAKMLQLKDVCAQCVSSAAELLKVEAEFRIALGAFCLELADKDRAELDSDMLVAQEPLKEWERDAKIWAKVPASVTRTALLKLADKLGRQDDVVGGREPTEAEREAERREKAQAAAAKQSSKKAGGTIVDLVGDDADNSNGENGDAGNRRKSGGGAASAAESDTSTWKDAGAKQSAASAMAEDTVAVATHNNAGDDKTRYRYDFLLWYSWFLMG